MKILPINLEDLIHARSVESVRRKFKGTWSLPIHDQTIRSICAFANDFFNLNGGYIVLGIEEDAGLPVLPPRGLDGHNLDEIQKQIRGGCKRIDPEYQPVISPEVYQDKQILVIWAPGGDVRPYQAPETLHMKGARRYYYVRQGSQTVEAQGHILTQLMQLAARVPFDDRRNASVSIDVLSPALVRNFLSDIRSDLVNPNVSIPDRDLYRFLRVSVPVNEHEVPRNVALLFFVNDPETYFSGARIEIVQFGDDAGGNLIEEKVFRGPVHAQLRQALDYLEAFSTSMVQKAPNRAEAHRTVAFPYEAMREALVNAVYHRSYDGVNEPTKVYLYPDRMEIISYPGPVPGIEQRHLLPGVSVPPVQNRNRRIGEFLKELALAEGRGTGIPKIRRKMAENGSPEPVFEFDDARTYFRVILPAHPQYVVIHALRESAQLWAVGERQKAISNLQAAAARAPNSGALLAQLIDYHAAASDLPTAEKLFADSEGQVTLIDRRLPFVAMARAYLDQQDSERAADILARAPAPSDTTDVVEMALLYKRAGEFRKAHNIFESAYPRIKDDPKAIHEYAQTKMRLAADVNVPGTRGRTTQTALYRTAAELLRRAIQLSNSPIRSAWAWYDLARTLARLRTPETEIHNAYSKAMELLPDEERFRQSYEQWKASG